jgi:SAM-dependent methyltransferase
MTPHGIAARVKRAIFGSPDIPEIDADLAARERVVRAPPLTPELVAAIKLIAPHYRITTSEEHRGVWEADQNAACWAEYLALDRILRDLPTPKRILEIGPGMGRSIVFFSKKFDWESDEIHALEGEGKAKKYTMLGPRFEDSFCGNLIELRNVLAHNGITNVIIHDAGAVSLASLPGPFDLIYSFYSIGFHWALDHFLDDILSLMAEGGTAIFTVPPGFEPSERILALPHEIVASRSPLRKRSEIRLIVLRKPAG